MYDELERIREICVGEDTRRVYSISSTVEERMDAANHLQEIESHLAKVKREIKRNGPGIEFTLTVKDNPSMTKVVTLNAFEAAKLYHSIDWIARRP